MILTTHAVGFILKQYEKSAVGKKVTSWNYSTQRSHSQARWFYDKSIQSIPTTKLSNNGLIVDKKAGNAGFS